MVDVQVGIFIKLFFISLRFENKSVKLINDKLNEITFDNVFFL